MTYKTIVICFYLALYSTLLETVNAWFVKHQHTITESDIGLWCQWPRFPKWDNNTVCVHCHKSVPVLLCTALEVAKM